MKIENDIKSIAIGSFDGVHKAHQELISLVDMVVVIERNCGNLTPGYRRADFAAKPCSFYHFDKIHGMSYDQAKAVSDHYPVWATFHINSTD